MARCSASTAASECPALVSMLSAIPTFMTRLLCVGGGWHGPLQASPFARARTTRPAERGVVLVASLPSLPLRAAPHHPATISRRLVAVASPPNFPFARARTTRPAERGGWQLGRPPQTSHSREPAARVAR